MIPIYKPYLPKESLIYAHDALNSTWISSQGKYIPMVTDKLSELLNIKYVLPVSNGTAACHLVAKALQKASQNTSNKIKIIVPNNVYVAAWNAFLFDKEYILIPIDANINSWNIDIDQLTSTINLYPDAIVLIVHNMGNIINVPNLKKQFPNTIFVEDNCEGLLGYYNSQLSGTASFASAISFFGNKNITSGEGGAFLTSDENSYLYAKCLYGQGQSGQKFIHQELGYNYRMSNIQAAILCGQLDIMNEIINKKQEIFSRYRQAFRDRDDIKIQEEEKNTKSANWMFGIRVLGSNYEKAEIYFNKANIEVRPMFYSIFTHQHLKSNESVYGVDCTNADLLNKKCIILPSYPELTKDEQNYIIDIVNNYVRTL